MLNVGEAAAVKEKAGAAGEEQDAAYAVELAAALDVDVADSEADITSLDPISPAPPAMLRPMVATGKQQIHQHTPEMMHVDRETV